MRNVQQKHSEAMCYEQNMGKAEARMVVGAAHWCQVRIFGSLS